MKQLAEYFSLQSKIYEYFGYVEDWVVLPLDDCLDYYWHLEGEGPGKIHFAETEAELNSKTGQYFVDDIYTQRFLKRWVYRGADYTMVCSNPNVDGNKFLRVFDNKKERVRP
jgi:hypothetical protein